MGGALPHLPMWRNGIRSELKPRVLQVRLLSSAPVRNVFCCEVRTGQEPYLPVTALVRVGNYTYNQKVKVCSAS